MSLPRFTMPIMNLQARAPDRKAATKPATRGSVPMLIAAMSPERISRSILPKITGITIRNEKLATEPFSLPRSSPVAMVVPERERPGSVASA